MDATKWVKTTSHRQRERLHARCRAAGREVPQPYFRRSTRPGRFRQEGEYWEIPAELDVRAVRGLVELKQPVPQSELIKPMSWEV